MSEETAEHRRLQEHRDRVADWKRFGPYLSERQWGTVREDYSEDGAAWEYLPHDHARSRAYRWGEDGLGGFSDSDQLLCLGLALWNGADPILKERLFGLTNAEGNHGEDVKELYYYLDATPTHSYNRFVYKYPQAPFPYAELVAENRRRGRTAPEFELQDTGVFAEGRYFDVCLEYAKAADDDILVEIAVHNRGPDDATIHVLPHLWLRNTWSWAGVDPALRPRLEQAAPGRVAVRGLPLGELHWHAEGVPAVLFTENETNVRRLFGVDAAGPFKDAFHEYVIGGDRSALAQDAAGTKVAAHHVLAIAAGGSTCVRVRLTPQAAVSWDGFGELLATRRREADEFYAVVQEGISEPDARLVQRQALAGLLWSKQVYRLDVDRWLRGDPATAAPPKARLRGRNRDWRQFDAAEVLSMPDKWEYPWFAAWDLAFHCIPLSLVDADFAKEQLLLMTREWYMHPNGQLPAYEWAFDDVNPPVHAWAAWRVFQIDRRQGGEGDLDFLERVFHKLLLNFTWWVNRKDAGGRNVFQGGFLGLDNIGVFDRSAPLPTGGHIDQADGTAWMGMYTLNLLRIALELSLHDPVYQDIATKFLEHFLYIAHAMTNIGDDGIGLWDDHDEFFYDVLETSTEELIPLKVRSMVGLIPLFAVEVIDQTLLDRLPAFAARLEWFLANRPDLADLVSRWSEPGSGERRLLSLLRGHRMKRLLARALDESEFLSPYGLRALSKVHEREPYVFEVRGAPLTVAYQPAESDSGLFGGNSNWRGPIWFPLNYLLIESLQQFHHYYSDDFRVECPTGAGRYLSLAEIADELSGRLAGIFTRDASGRRAVFGDNGLLQNDEHFRDLILFHEYFHGDTGRGVGASHQTGWTGLVAKLLQARRSPVTGEWLGLAERRALIRPTAKPT